MTQRVQIPCAIPQALEPGLERLESLMPSLYSTRVDGEFIFRHLYYTAVIVRFCSFVSQAPQAPDQVYNKQVPEVNNYCAGEDFGEFFSTHSSTACLEASRRVIRLLAATDLIRACESAGSTTLLIS